MLKQATVRRRSAQSAPSTRSQRKGATPLRIRRLLVPTDFSDAANAALVAAVPWLERFQAELHLVHVYSLDYPVPAMMVPSLIVSESQIRRQVRSHLQEVARDHGMPVQRIGLHASSGRPFEKICRLARQLEIDLIITATRGRTGLKHLALGSTAERRGAPRAVSDSHCPPAGRFRPSSDDDLQENPGRDRFFNLCRARPGLRQSARRAVWIQARAASLG